MLNRPGSIYGILHYSMGWSDPNGKSVSAQTGKALRPALCLFANETVCGKTVQALPIAASLELIHNFSLIHDDIQDRDESRHGRPTVWKMWGDAKALQAGNVMRVCADLALQDLVTANVNTNIALRVSSVLNEVFLEVVQGQYLDLCFEETTDITINDYFQMTSMKTGALIRASLELGALIGNSESRIVTAFRLFGRSLGTAFQISDDLLGIWGNEQSTGKPVGSDIKRKKKTLPIVLALSLSKPSDRKRMMTIFNQKAVSDSDLGVVLEMMGDLGVKQEAELMAKEHCQKAIDALAEVPMAEEFRERAIELASFLINRDS